MLHLAHAAQQRHQAALVRKVDCDVVILAIHFFSSLGLSQLWVCLGSGKKIRDIPIHPLSAQLGPSRCLALPLFHAVTACDTVSQFLGCGKKSAWSAWQSTPGLTDTLVALTSEPQSEMGPQCQHMCTLERFVVVMYSKGCGLERVNQATHRLFTSGKKTLEVLPTTQAALCQHIRRAMLQASFFWSQATSVHQDIPDFHDWGGTMTAVVGSFRSGQPLRTAARPVPSFCSVDARSHTQGTASAAELAFVAQVCANAKVDV